jgi:serine/threonine protein kinase
LVAIKRLYSPDVIEFEKEVIILKALGSKAKHPHLITLLATFRHKKKYHLMFPYADANLRTYWEDRKTPNFDEATVLWSVKQMTGIAHALSQIHNFSVTHPLTVDGQVRVQKDAKLCVEDKEELYGRHGDIKPENILWFQKCPEPEEQDPNGILQIADFGLGRFHGRDSRSRVPPEDILGSPTYEPPECKLHRPVSRAYDIWSLGCLYLEFITWLLKGSAEIEDFSDFRGRLATGTELNDDNFFTMVKNAANEPDAIVRDEVIAWVQQLHEHERCSLLIHDLLDLIMKDVLLIDSTKRAKARWLFQQLNMYLKKANDDKAYALKPAPVRPKLENIEHSKSNPPTLDARKTTKGKNVTFQNENAGPSSATPSSSPRDLVNRTAGTPGLITRSKTHGAWPPLGPMNG